MRSMTKVISLRSQYLFIRGPQGTNSSLDLLTKPKIHFSFILKKTRGYMACPSPGNGGLSAYPASADEFSVTCWDGEFDSLMTLRGSR